MELKARLISLALGLVAFILLGVHVQGPVLAQQYNLGTYPNVGYHWLARGTAPLAGYPRYQDCGTIGWACGVIFYVNTNAPAPTTTAYTDPWDSEGTAFNNLWSSTQRQNGFKWNGLWMTHADYNINTLMSRLGILTELPGVASTRVELPKASWIPLRVWAASPWTP